VHSISIWLKQVVLLVLLATFIDMLLPNQALSRYVKLVMGLLIILAILNPILAILTDRFHWEALSWQHLRQWSDQEVPTLAQIEEQSQQFKEMRQKQVIEAWKGQVTHMMKQDLQKKFALRVLSLQVEARDKGGAPTLTNVELVAVVEKHEQPAAPLKPIEIGKETRQDKAEGLQKKVRAYFHTVWHMDHPVIQIRTG
jgi:stage III sporulation protein AF